jgi:hypothetical protein
MILIIYYTMLTVEDIIKYLAIPQKKIDPVAGSAISTYQNVPLTTITSLHQLFNECYYIQTFDGNFYEALMISLDKFFMTMIDKDDNIKALRKKLIEDMDVSFKQFRYNKKRKFNKQAMQKELMNFSNLSVSEGVMKYICDYFGINLYMITDISQVSAVIATDDSEYAVEYKPCIILYQPSPNIYYPIYKKDLTSPVLYSKESIVKDFYYRFVQGKFKRPATTTANEPMQQVNTKEEEQPVVLVAATETAVPLSIKKKIIKIKRAPAPIVVPTKTEEEESPTPQPPTPPPSIVIHKTEAILSTRKRATTKMSIAELQYIAKDLSIDIMKKRGEVSIQKTKKELYDEINT